MTSSKLAGGPSDEEICAEAIYRVDRRHAGCVVLEALDDEYELEALHVASLARQYSWAQVVSTPKPIVR